MLNPANNHPTPNQKLAPAAISIKKRPMTQKTTKSP
jgi:hypothetical protein